MTLCALSADSYSESIDRSIDRSVVLCQPHFEHRMHDIPDTCRVLHTCHVPQRTPVTSNNLHLSRPDTYTCPTTYTWRRYHLYFSNTVRMEDVQRLAKADRFEVVRNVQEAPHTAPHRTAHRTAYSISHSHPRSCRTAARVV